MCNQLEEIQVFEVHEKQTILYVIDGLYDDVANTIWKRK